VKEQVGLAAHFRLAMMKHRYTARCATAAIAAALALGTTGLAAQTVTVPTDAPVTTAAPPPIVQPEPTVSQPAVTVPDAAAPAPVPQAAMPSAATPRSVTVPMAEPSAVPVEAEPVEAAAPPRAAPSSAPAPSTRTTRTAAPAEAAPASSAPATNDDEAPASAEPALPADAAAIPPVASEPLAPSVPLAQAEEPGSVDWLALGAGAIVILAALGGLAVILRRRRPAQAQALPVEREKTAPAAAVYATPAPEPLFHQTVRFVSDARPVAARTVRSGAAVDLPARMPTSFEERDALVRRMVAARPDRANPFRSPKARVRRARLILQSLDHSFADRDPWIDLSDYPNNWPEVARRNFAHAA